MCYFVAVSVWKHWVVVPASGSAGVANKSVAGGHSSGRAATAINLCV